MGFSIIAPPEKLKKGTIKVSCKGKNGNWRVMLSIPTAQLSAVFGDASRFTLMLGDGADEGKLAIISDGEGAFKPTFFKSAVLFRLPQSNDTPQIELTHDDLCHARRELSIGGEMRPCVVVDMPNWFWEKGRWQKIRDARSMAARQVNAERSRG